MDTQVYIVILQMDNTMGHCCTGYRGAHRIGWTHRYIELYYRWTIPWDIAVPWCTKDHRGIMDNTMGHCCTMVPRMGWTHRYGLLQQGYYGQYHGTLLYHGAHRIGCRDIAKVYQKMVRVTV